jgi:hypothetical protein
VTAIWGTDPNGHWLPLAPTAYLAEAELHYLVGKAPQMLPLAGTPQLTVLGREVRLGSGYADLLAVESTGRLVVIEVKLSTNAESRRAVVAQVLSYAGYLQGLDLAQLESQILREDLGAVGSVLGAVQADERQEVVDPEAFHDGISRSLADGGFRLVIVLDSAPDELIQVVGYLQMVTDKIDIDLVTVTAYEVKGSRVLVPQRIEPARRTREMSDAAVNARQSGTQTDGSRDFRSAIDQAPPEFRDDLARLTDWAESLEAEGLARLATRSGISRISSLKPLLHSEGVALVTITCDVKSAYMQFFRSVFERRAAEAISAVEAALGTKITQGNSTRTFTEELLTALTDAYRQAHANPVIQYEAVAARVSRAARVRKYS